MVWQIALSASATFCRLSCGWFHCRGNRKHKSVVTLAWSRGTLKSLVFQTENLETWEFESPCTWRHHAQAAVTSHRRRTKCQIVKWRRRFIATCRVLADSCLAIFDWSIQTSISRKMRFNAGTQSWFLAVDLLNFDLQTCCRQTSYITFASVAVIDFYHLQWTNETLIFWWPHYLDLNGLQRNRVFITWCYNFQSILSLLCNVYGLSWTKSKAGSYYSVPLFALLCNKRCGDTVPYA